MGIVPMDVFCIFWYVGYTTHPYNFMLAMVLDMEVWTVPLSTVLLEFYMGIAMYFGCWFKN